MKIKRKEITKNSTIYPKVCTLSRAGGLRANREGFLYNKLKVHEFIQSDIQQFRSASKYKCTDKYSKYFQSLDYEPYYTQHEIESASMVLDHIYF